MPEIETKWFNVNGVPVALLDAFDDQATKDRSNRAETVRDLMQLYVDGKIRRIKSQLVVVPMTGITRSFKAKQEVSKGKK